MSLDQEEFAELRRLYPDLDPSLFDDVHGVFQRVQCAGGAELMREGDAADGLYILLNGRLRVTKKTEDGRTHVVGEISRGEMVGEMGLLGEGTRTATVMAIRDSDLLRLSTATFYALLQRHPGMSQQLFRVLMARLGRPAPPERLSTVAVIDRDNSAHTRSSVHALSKVLTEGSPVLLLDAAVVEQALGAGSAQAEAGTRGHEALAGWLNDQERAHQLVVYLPDATPTAWTQRCLRQADRVLIVADANASPALSPLEQYILGRNHAATELALVHAQDSARPEGTARWLETRKPRQHHHLRIGSQETIARLARHLLGRSLGLVLGGGGAKALSQIGLLRAMAEAGIAVDIVGGTSMGSAIGALVASGLDHREIASLMRDMVRLRPFRGITYPILSLLSGRRLNRAINQLFGERRIEDLWLRYFCVTCNLSRLAVAVHEAGPLSLWVRASSAIPGIMPPALDNGELHVDGALLNNLPADVMRRIGAGTIITCNVSAAEPLRSEFDFGASPSGWNLLLRRYTGQKFPGAGRVLFRSVLLASAQHAESVRAYSDVYLTPPVASHEISDWNAIDRLIELGYRYASESIPHWNLPG